MAMFEFTRWFRHLTEPRRDGEIVHHVCIHANTKRSDAKPGPFGSTAGLFRTWLHNYMSAIFDSRDGGIRRVCLLWFGVLQEGRCDLVVADVGYIKVELVSKKRKIKIRRSVWG